MINNNIILKDGTSVPSFFNKEEIIKFYIEENHTFKESIVYFNTTRAKFTKFLKDNNIVKDTTLYLDDYLNNINKDEFTIFYKTHTIDETKQKFNLKNNAILYKIVKAFNINKNKTTFDKCIEIVNKDELSKYYLEHSRKETIKHFNISDKKLSKLLKHFNIKKHITMDEAIQLISKEEVEDYYLLQNHTHAETIEYFKNKYLLNYLPDIIYKYQITKSNATAERILKYIAESTDKLTMNELSQKVNTGYCNITHIVKKLNLEDKISSSNITSSYEIEIQKFLTDNNINFTTHNRELLLGQELDLYINDYNIGIEFNGDYWHSSLYKNKNYHLDKSKLAKEAGIRLIHIWEYEWRDVIKQEIIKSIILTACGIVSKKIFARKCHVKQISNSVAKIFLQKNHLFGYRAANLTYGLYYDNELVQIMSFSRNKYNKNIKNSTTWEIIRSCTKINTVVIGGINKILKKFISSNDVSIIFSYCDFNKFDGKGYAAANMEFIGYTGPNLLWLFEDHVVKNRNPKTHAFDQQNSIAKIWQAGSLKYQINIKK